MDEYECTITNFIAKEGPLNWPKEIYSLSKLTPSTDPEEWESKINGLVKSSNMSYSEAIFADTLATMAPTPKARDGSVAQTKGALKHLKDERIDSWMSELIQNAQDVEANILSVTVEENSLTFSHNGSKFKLKELHALFLSNVSTKATDIRTIGRFGIGFKYWLKFYTFLEVKSYDYDGYSYSIKVSGKGDYEPRFKKIKHDKSLTNPKDSVTEFIFSDKIKNKTKSENIVSNRVIRSLPLLHKSAQDFNFTLNSNGEKNSYSVSRNPEIQDNIVDNTKIQHLNVNAATKESNTKCIKLSLSMKYFKEKFPEDYQSLLSEIEKEVSYWAEGNADMKHTEKETLPKLDITLVYPTFNESQSGGVLAVKFVAEQATIKPPILFDAPFMLTPNRLNLDLNAAVGDRGDFNIWNGKLLKFAQHLHLKSIPLILQQQPHYDFPLKDLDNLINTSFNSKEGSTIDDLLKVIDSGDTFYKSLEPLLLKNKNEKVKRYYGCSLEVLELWRYLCDLENGDDALEWFLNALHPQLARIKLNSGEVLLVGEGRGFEPLPEESHPICRSYGVGIPEEIITHINEKSDPESITKPTLMFATITEDMHSGNYYFHYQRPNSIITKFEEYEDNFKEQLIAINGELHDIKEIPSLYTIHFPQGTEEWGDWQKVQQKLGVEAPNAAAQIAHATFVQSKNSDKIERLENIGILSKFQELKEIKPIWGDSFISKLESSNHTYFVRLAPEKSRPAIIVNRNRYALSSLETSNISGELNNSLKLNAADEQSELLVWGVSPNPLWGFSVEDIEMQKYLSSKPHDEEGERTANLPDGWKWQNLDAQLPQGKLRKWNWVALEIPKRIEPNRINCYFIDAIHWEECDDYSQTDELRGIFFTDVAKQWKNTLSIKSRKYPKDTCVRKIEIPENTTGIEEKSLIRSAIGLLNGQVKVQQIRKRPNSVNHFIEFNSNDNIERMKERVKSISSLVDNILNGKNGFDKPSVESSLKRLEHLSVEIKFFDSAVAELKVDTNVLSDSYTHINNHFAAVAITEKQLSIIETTPPKVRSHAIIRIQDANRFIFESISKESIQPELKDQHIFDFTTFASEKPSGSKLFDVYWAKGEEKVNGEWNLSVRYIPLSPISTPLGCYQRKTKENSEYQMRYSNHECFEPLREHGIIPFMEEKTFDEIVAKIIHPEAYWCPFIINERSELDDLPTVDGLQMIPLSNKNTEAYDLFTTNKKDSGKAYLPEIISLLAKQIWSETSQAPDSKRCLEQLAKKNLIKIGASPISTDNPPPGQYKTILREYIKKTEVNKEVYPNLYELLYSNKETIPIWFDFCAAVQRNASDEQLEDYMDTTIPQLIMLSSGEITHRDDGPTISDLIDSSDEEREKYHFTKERITDEVKRLYRLNGEDSKLLDLNYPYYTDRSDFFDRINSLTDHKLNSPFSSLNIIANELIESESETAMQYLPESLKWIVEFFEVIRKGNEELDVSFVIFKEPVDEERVIQYSDRCPSFNIKGNKIKIVWPKQHADKEDDPSSIVNPLTLPQHEHLWRILRKEIPGRFGLDINNIIYHLKSEDILGPWWWSKDGGENEKKEAFIKKYCRGDLKELRNFYEDFDTKTVQECIDSVKGLYAGKNPMLEHSRLDLEVIYNGNRTSICNHLVNPDYSLGSYRSIRVKNNVQFPLEILEKTNSDTLGEYFIMNQVEWGHFGRTNRKGKEKIYNLAFGYHSLIKKHLIEQEEEDYTNQWITVPGLFEDETDENRIIKVILHKVHAIFILGYLSWGGQGD
jgi:hypothetical protein